MPSYLRLSLLLCFLLLHGFKEASIWTHNFLFFSCTSPLLFNSPFCKNPGSERGKYSSKCTAGKKGSLSICWSIGSPSILDWLCSAMKMWHLWWAKAHDLISWGWGASERIQTSCYYQRLEYACLSPEWRGLICFRESRQMLNEAQWWNIGPSLLLLCRYLLCTAHNFCLFDIVQIRECVDDWGGG